MSVYIEAYQHHLASHFETKTVSEKKGTSMTFGSLQIDTSSTFYPNRSDLKIMREDATASVICVRQLVQRLSLSTADKAEIPVFVANGAFVDKPERYLRRLPEVYSGKNEGASAEQTMTEIYQRVPPLLALETLTNSSMSYLAQYVGLKGHNATFGNTSAAGYYALKSACDISENPSIRSLVCASDCSDLYSYLANSPLVDDTRGWKESAAVGVLSITQSAEKAVAKISRFAHDHRIPDFLQNTVLQNWNELLPAENSQLIVFSGAFTPSQYEKDKNYLGKRGIPTYSHFPLFGNSGPANLILGIIYGLEKLSASVSVIDILDRDVYGRETAVRIERC